MKSFAILLLIGNVVLAGWQYNEYIRAETLAAAGPAPLPLRAPGLKLVSELPALPSTRKVTSANGLGDSFIEEQHIVQAVDLSTELNDIGIASNTCLEVGPIIDEQRLKDLRAWLSTRATAVHTRMETIRERRFFWVYLEAVSDEEARKNLSDLEASGVTDYMLIRRGGLKNAISLGLFRSQDSVNRRLAEMTQKGYQPVVVPKFETTNSYYVTATMAEGDEDTTAVPAELYADAELETKSCGNVDDVLEGAAMNEDFDVPEWTDEEIQ